MNILNQILSYKKEVVKKEKAVLPLEELKSRLNGDLSEPNFKKRLSAPGLHLIAEVKKASPSAGLICKVFDPVAIAKAYEAAGAACISVLTEDKFFQGSLELLERIRAATHLPLLRKDFIFDEYQLYQSKLYGADAVLLIAAILTKKEMHHLVGVARRLDLDVLLEVHADNELETALENHEVSIGINTRNLEDFTIHFDLCAKLASRIGSERLVVCESGIKSVSDLEAAGRVQNIKAVLIGEALMRSQDMVKTTKEFVAALNRMSSFNEAQN